MKKLLVVFPEGNLRYSPSTLNLIESFKKQFEIHVLGKSYWEPDGKSFQDLGFNFITIPEHDPYSRHARLKGTFYRLTKFVFGKGTNTVLSDTQKHDFKIIAKFIQNEKPEVVIAVDLFALYCCEKLNIECFFLSFEIPSRSPFFSSLNYKNIKAVIIQSQKRYEHLFYDKENKPPFFLLPNAPIFEYPDKRTIPSKKIVYSGYIWSAFGPQFCLSFVTKFPEYELHIKGGIHGENLIKIYFPFLIESKSFFLDTEYLRADEMKHYLRNFSIGFCFYNFEHYFIKENFFNYYTAPSGKLFSYLAEGLPVICSNIEGFKIVELYGAGILLSDYSPDTIKLAVDTILENYSYYSDNALKLAEANCFKKSIQPIQDFITS